MGNTLPWWVTDRLLWAQWAIQIAGSVWTASNPEPSYAREQPHTRAMKDHGALSMEHFAMKDHPVVRGPLTGNLLWPHTGSLGNLLWPYTCAHAQGHTCTRVADCHPEVDSHVTLVAFKHHDLLSPHHSHCYCSNQLSLILSCLWQHPPG